MITYQLLSCIPRIFFLPCSILCSDAENQQQHYNEKATQKFSSPPLSEAKLGISTLLIPCLSYDIV